MSSEDDHYKNPWLIWWKARGISSCYPVKRLLEKSKKSYSAIVSC